MLKSNIKRMLTLRGVSQPIGFLMKKGYSRNLASRLSKDELQRFSLKLIEKICITFNCMPNDIFDWRPDKSDPDTLTLKLNALKKSQPNEEALDFSDIPMENLEELNQAIKETKERFKG